MSSTIAIERLYEGEGTSRAFYYKSCPVYLEPESDHAIFLSSAINRVTGKEQFPQTMRYEKYKLTINAEKNNFGTASARFKIRANKAQVVEPTQSMITTTEPTWRPSSTVVCAVPMSSSANSCATRLVSFPSAIQRVMSFTLCRLKSSDMVKHPMM